MHSKPGFQALLAALLFASTGCDDIEDALDGASLPPPPVQDSGAGDALVPGAVPGTATPGDAAVFTPTPTPLLDGGVSPGDSGATLDGATDGDAGPTTPGSAAAGCLDGITDYQKAGPFKFSTKTSGKVKFWVPAVPAGCKVPVVHLANGTGASCANYQQALERMATHGFLAACYEDPNTGAGTQGIEAFDAAYATFPELADDKLGSTGHSQGGQGAFTVLQLAEAKWNTGKLYAGLAMQPASGFGTQPAGGSWQQVYAKIKSPMFMFSGTADILVSESWVKQGFDALSNSVEAYNWSAVGSTHIPTPQEQEMEVSIPWFRWKLLGDAAACEFFKKMPDGPDWDERQVQNAAPCQ